MPKKLLQLLFVGKKLQATIVLRYRMLASAEQEQALC